MKFLDAKGGEPRESITEKDIQNKMHKGTRSDQKGEKLDPKDPQSLISSSKGRAANTDGKTEHKLGGRTPSNTPDATTTEVTNLAKSLNVDLGKVSGTGTNGTITEQDVRNAAK